MSTHASQTTATLDDTAPATKPSGLIRFITLDALAKADLRDVGLLVLRLFTLLIFLHGLHKAQGFDGFVGMMQQHPVGAIAPLLFGGMVVVGQLLLGFGLSLGLATRWCGLLLALMFAFIILTVNIPFNGLLDAKRGGVTFESSLFYFVPAVVLLLTGPGRFSIDHLLVRK